MSAKFLSIFVILYFVQITCAAPFLTWNKLNNGLTFGLQVSPVTISGHQLYKSQLPPQNNYYMQQQPPQNYYTNFPYSNQYPNQYPNWGGYQPNQYNPYFPSNDVPPNSPNGNLDLDDKPTVN